MNRYDYYTRCSCMDEQEWLTGELYYPENEAAGDCRREQCCEEYWDYEGDEYDKEAWREDDEQCDEQYGYDEESANNGGYGQDEGAGQLRGAAGGDIGAGYDNADCNHSDGSSSVDVDVGGRAGVQWSQEFQ